MRSAIWRSIYIVLLLLILTHARQAFAAGTPKDMFYQELKGADSSGSCTVAYCLELHRGDAPPTLCNNRYSFASGDGLRLHIKSTISGYAYIALIGSSGKKSVIYPPTPDEDNRVEAGKEVLVPGKGMIVFDDKPGTEQLFVILSEQQLDASRDLDGLSAANLGGDLLSGLPVKVGKYQVMSNDGFYDLGEKTPGSGLVYVTNPDRSQPTVLSLALDHASGAAAASSTNPSSSPPTKLPNDAGGSQNIRNNYKTQYDVASIHNDGDSDLERTEVYRAFKQVPGKLSGVNCGMRDQYVAGLNHLYANFLLQQLKSEAGHLYYVQLAKGRSDSGERIKAPSFSGAILPSENQPISSPGPVATFDGIAFIETCLSGGKANLVGGTLHSKAWHDPKIYNITTGHDLDAAWEAINGPVIMGVDCRANMFGRSGDSFKGHVVVLSERRQKRDGPGRTSNFEYRLLNSWGKDSNGRLRNGWVSGDAAAAAMNFTDAAHDESTNPQRALDPDQLPLPGPNVFARGDDGLMIEYEPWQRAIVIPDAQTILDARNLQSDGSDSYQNGDRSVKDEKAEAADLMRFVMNRKEGFSAEDLSLIDRAVKGIISNKSDDANRPYPLSQQQKAGVLHEANRLFSESVKIYAQGLDQQDRNRAVIAMLHDNANPEHINQGAHETCNVTTIMKIETLLRPAAQAKRFVDMYTNANNNQTASIP